MGSLLQMRASVRRAFALECSTTTTIINQHLTCFSRPEQVGRRPKASVAAGQAVIYLGLVLAAEFAFTPLAVCGAVFTNLTTLKAIQESVVQSGREIASFQVKGIVCAVQTDRRLLALQDESATELLELPLPKKPLAPGMSVALEGTNCVLTRTAFGVQIGTAPVAEMDGLHPQRGDSGSVFLAAGYQPVRVEWFNGIQDGVLHVEYDGPSMPRHAIPEGVLAHRAQPGSDATAFAPGLEYRAYEGDGWQVLPNFDKLQPAASGVTPGFDVSKRTRHENSGMVFSGFLRITNSGTYRFHIRSDDGARIFVGNPAASAMVIPLDDPPRQPVVRKFMDALAERNNQQWVSVEGNVGFVDDRNGRVEFDIMTQGRRFEVTVVDGGTLKRLHLASRRVRVTGICQLWRGESPERAPRLIVAGAEQVEFAPPLDGSGTNIVLTTASKIRRLQPEEARKPFRAKVRGVITWATHWACVLQDFSGAVFVLYEAREWDRQPRPEELWEIEGVTDPGDFSPIIKPTQATYLGKTVLPEPMIPTWDRLANGSLDAEMVEVRGVVLDFSPAEMTLLTRDGKVTILSRTDYLLPEMSDKARQSLHGSIVRMRGVLAALWDRGTHRLMSGRFYLGNAVLSVEDGALASPELVAPIRAADLLLFTSHIEALTRVKIKGQVLYSQSRELILLDGEVGFRATLKEPQTFREGDILEVSGFPQLGAPSPVLLVAGAQKVGSQPRQQPVPLSEAELINRSHDATLVKVEAIVLSDAIRSDERVLEIQAGQVRFFARLNCNGAQKPAIRPQSRLQLTGVYSAMSRENAADNTAGFELLLNRPTDIAVLSQGPWWTKRHTIASVAGLVAALAVAGFWIVLLRRMVANRTLQLQRETENRQLIEHHRILEHERSRIAQDLHDELGAGLTEMSILGDLASNPALTREKQEGYINRLSELSRSLVTGLDEIVWAVNPRHDSTASVSGYLSEYAQEYLERTGILCSLDIAETLPDIPLNPHQRHNLFLAFKESLTNVVKHAQATEVRVRIGGNEHELWIAIEDNGVGLGPDDAEPQEPRGNGVSNMMRRMNQIKGECGISNRAGGGTSVRFRLQTERKMTSV